MKYFLSLSLLFLFSITFYTLDASYEGETLQIIERSYTHSKGLYDSEGLPDYTVSLDTPLFSIYWNPLTTNYYFVEDGAGMIRTNGLTYKIDTNRLETSYTGENIDPYLTFVGHISTNERLYIDNRNTNQQYIKVLELIKDQTYFDVPLFPFKNTPASMIKYSPNGLGSGKGRFYNKKGVITWKEPDFPI